MRNLIILLFLSIISSVVSQAKELITIQNDLLSVSVSPDGAELQSIQSKQTGNEYLWHGDATYWDMRAPLMFPIIVRFKDDEYTYRGKRYQLPLLGLAKYRTLEVVAVSTDAVTFELTSDASTLKAYPFEFNFRLTYQLNGNQLTHNFEIKNTGKNTMFYTLGGHPGFVLKKPRSNYELTFSEALTTDRNLVIGGLIQEATVPFLTNDTRLPLNDERVPDHGMLLRDVSNIRIGVAETGKDPFVEIDFGNLKNTNIWTPSGKPYVCIEPLLGHHDYQDTPIAIEEKSYLTQLESNETQLFHFSILVNE